MWAEHFRSGAKSLIHKTWSEQLDWLFFDDLCKDAKAFCNNQSKLILPEAYPFLEIQVVRRGLVLPLLKEMMRHGPLNKFSSTWNKPATECNLLAAELLTRQTKSLATQFQKATNLKNTNKQMGVAALHDEVQEFLVGDAAALQAVFIKLHETFEHDFRFSHAQRLLGWRTDLDLDTRQQVIASFRIAVGANLCPSQKRHTESPKSSPKQFFSMILQSFKREY